MLFRISVLLLLLIPFAVHAQETSDADRAQAILQQFISGDSAGIYDQLSDQLKAAIPQTAFGQAWPSIVQQFGAFQQVINTQADATTHGVTLTLQFEHGLLDLHVAFDASGKIVGLSFTPSALSPTPVVPTPAYADTSAFTETAVTVGDLKLPGILTMPTGAPAAGGLFPAVVLISGSGPNDADESIGPHKVFRDIAWGLAAQGIATLRFDKRTKAAPQSLDMTSLTVKEEYVDDSVAAVELMRQTEGIDPARVFIFGHSEGGYVAPRIAAADPKIAGVILAAALSESLPDAVLRQYHYLASLNKTSPEATEDAAFVEGEAEVEKIAALTADSPKEEMVFHAPPSYWLDLRDYDPVALEASLPQPVLVLQGGRDYQVTVADDLSLWQKGLANHADVTFKVYDDLNHIFTTGTGLSTPAEYNQPGDVSKALIDDTAAWVKAH